MDTETQPRAYPESFAEGEQAQAQSQTELKLTAGQRVRMKVISGPLTYHEEYFKVGTKEDGNDKKMRVALPFGSQLPGYPLKTKYLVEVVLLDGPAKGQNKLFSFGQQVWNGLNEVKNTWQSIRIPDIVVSRKGSTKDDTKYSVTAGPSTVEASTLKVTFDLEKEVRYSKAEDLAKLPPPPVGRETSDSMTSHVTHAQLDMIESLAKQKEVSQKDLQKMVERKFGKAIQPSDLTMGQASAIIDLLKNY